ncbi:hypothetical protein DFQ11_10312 [Winogradskyella epiphytica]|uniref:Uncharacterized protein n=1 Tax=Winogradskyella epiphytica TaxID=262005 RepID=A0A2V4WW41_9FLAO|nr:hypothetical protein [Winogradskyella epiphytica]PYE80932.1 hypothetical protein DFQ11_10312 [Winogradskyella epiphytica]GGW65626.1 hypothetical protein GCM10008085_16760 [Winogradskyella epiphytica]
MPKFDLLLLPLLGGYVFLITFKLTKFYHQRIERQRLIFNSLILAFFVSLLGLFLDEYVLKSACLINIRESLGNIIPINYSGLNHSILIFLIAFPFAKFLNFLISNRYMLNYVVDKWGDEYEKLFWSSLQSKNDEDKLLMITTKNNKVYVGYVSRISEPIGNSHITIIPNFSGYRDKDTQEFILTTDYISVLQYFIKNDQERLIDDKMGILIPKSEIILVSKFDYNVFDRFNNFLEEPNLREQKL